MKDNPPPPADYVGTRRLHWPQTYLLVRNIGLKDDKQQRSGVVGRIRVRVRIRI